MSDRIPLGFLVEELQRARGAVPVSSGTHPHVPSEYPKRNNKHDEEDFQREQQLQQRHSTIRAQILNELKHRHHHHQHTYQAVGTLDSCPEQVHLQQHGTTPTTPNRGGERNHKTPSSSLLAVRDWFASRESPSDCVPPSVGGFLDKRTRTIHRPTSAANTSVEHHETIVQTSTSRFTTTIHGCHHRNSVIGTALVTPRRTI